MVPNSRLRCCIKNSQLKLLPRGFDSPASLLAAVYASEKLKSWAGQQHERRSMAEKSTHWRRGKDRSDDEAVAARMGYCIGADRNEHWGIELVDEHSPLLVDEVSEDTEAPSRAGERLLHQQPSLDHAAAQNGTTLPSQPSHQNQGPSGD